MSDFKQAYQLVLTNEGGYVNDPDDPGGETYKGIARKLHSSWNGWQAIDNLKHQQGFPGNLDLDIILQSTVEEFYRINFWVPMNGNQIINQQVANSIFDFGVNAGLSTSVSLAQTVVNAKADGVLGPKSLAAINSFDAEHFIDSFTIAKITRYINIVRNRPESKKYFFGWVSRAIGV